MVVDEYHTWLDASEQFRPQMLRLGQMLREWGVQRVFLTATLPPDEQEAFFQLAGIHSRLAPFLAQFPRLAGSMGAEGLFERLGHQLRREAAESTLRCAPCAHSARVRVCVRIPNIAVIAHACARGRVAHAVV